MSINDIIGQVGLGGESGFEIQQSGSPEPYEVITKALVKDDTTQEVKLLVATSRNSSASSNLGTMAVDVFPLQGRPHMKDLVVTPLNLEEDNIALTPIQITTASIPVIYAGKPMAEVTLLTNNQGHAPYSWFSTDLPAGLFLDLDGTLHGTPMVIGTFTLNVSVSDSSSPASIDAHKLSLVISSDLALGDVVLPAGTVGSDYLDPITHAPVIIPVSGGAPPYIWALDNSVGDPPIGLSLVDGVLTGYPVTYNSTTDFTKTFHFGVTVTDSLGATVTKQYSMPSLLPHIFTVGAPDTMIVWLSSLL